jgi:drug/metabolite transporter (DMT)-like permease
MILGVVLALVTTLAYNAAFVLEKRALATLPPLKVRQPVSFARVLLTNPRWMVGFVLMLGGLASQLVALTRVPLTVAQPVFSSGIAFLLLLTMTVLGERLTGHECIGLGGITAGVIFVVTSLDARTDAAGDGGHVIGVLAVALPSTFIGLTIFVLAGRTGNGRHRRPTGDVPYGLAAGIVYGVTGVITKGLSASIDFHGFAAIARSAALSPYLYLLAPVTIAGFLVFQSALQRGRASIVAPVSSVISTLYTVVAGTAVFGEHLPTDPVRLLLRLAGLASITAALFWLPRRRRPPGRAVPVPQPRPAMAGTTGAPAGTTFPAPDRAAGPASAPR